MIDAREAERLMKLWWPVLKNPQRKVVGHFAKVAVYRKRRRYIVGYLWTYRYSHFLTGKVSQNVKGYGDSFQEAVRMARDHRAAEGGALW